VLDQRGVRGEALERAVEEAAALVVRHLDTGAEVALAVAGQFLPAGTGEAQRCAALRMLALLEETADAAPPRRDPAAAAIEVRG
jgi:uncharacterized protein (DUF58 family)